jgi:hypothetical protein
MRRRAEDLVDRRRLGYERAALRRPVPIECIDTAPPWLSGAA